MSAPAFAAASPAPGRPQFSHREKVVIIAGLMLGMFLAALDQTIIAAALPRMAADLHDVEHMSWIVSAYLLTSTAVTPIYGKLSDLYGRKLMLQTAILIFLLTSLLCGLASDMGQLIAFRALQGLGGGGLLAMAHATIADVVSPRERGRYQGYIASVFAASSVIGPVLGGLFVEHLSWAWVFWINLPLGLAALFVAQTTLKRLQVKRLRHKIDYPGAVLIVAAVTCILLITTMGGNDAAWSSPVILWLGIAAAALFLLSLWQEARAPEPILPPRLFRNRAFTVANTAGLLLSMVMIGGLIFLPLFLQVVYRLSPGDSGLMLIPLTCLTVTGAITSGQLVARTGRYKIFPMIGLTLVTIAMTLLATAPLHTSLLRVGVYMALSGFGIGLVMPVMLVTVQNAVEPRDLGVGTASISFFRSMGGSFGVALFGAVLIARLNHWAGQAPDLAAALGAEPGIRLLHAGTGALDLAPAALHPALAEAILRSFHEVFGLGAVIAAVALAVFLLLREIPLRTTPGMSGDEVPAGAPAD
ncbi:MAG TPA: MDR family MFS transporter [Ferrovibrio sp.]|uniref:MDR family MFS transporter n=1 Tax=Ferrovibrio sp. TaxID=1917215 RepID=UPI002ED26978